MATVQELQEAIDGVKAAVDADVAQDLLVVQAINALLERITPTPDLQPLIDQLREASSKLASDNAAVQAAIDAAVPPAPQNP